MLPSAKGTCEDGPYLAAEDSGIPVLTDLPTLLDIADRVESDTADYGELNRLLRAGSSLGGARPKAHVLDSGGRIIDRFDRQGTARIGYASAMTMLEAGDGDQRSYLEIAEVIEERSTTVTTDLRELWRRVCFSILISNTDDHLRNHGFLHERAESWALSPAFDLNPNPAPGPKELSTAIDFNATQASIDTLIGVADYFRLDARAAAEVLAQVTSAVGHWRPIAASHGLRQAEIEAMAPAFEHAERDRARTIVESRRE